MADSKKYNESTWEHSLRKLGTATETLTLPQIIYADGTAATVSLKGNTVQNGTPTPDNPIMPQGTGEMTVNLFDYSAITTGYRIQWTNGAPYADDTAIMSDYIPVTEGDYTLNISSIIIGYAADKSYIGVYRSEETWEKLPSDPISSFTILSNTNVEFVRLLTYSIYAPITDALMLNEGSTPLPYEPYGQYKIPILNNSQTTNVYLGEVQSTRRVKKQVVTISRIIESGTPNMKIAVVALDTSLVSPRTALSTVVPYGNASTPETFYYINANNIGMVGAVGDTDEQITAKYEGSILYYGIAETTGIVNEPLMKIGDYADTVSGITIPTITGKDTFDVQTTLKPSEVSLSYTGWHDAMTKEWDGSQWNE